MQDFLIFSLKLFHVLILQLDVFDAAERYRRSSEPLLVLAGKEYGSGSSRDWAAKGPFLLVRNTLGNVTQGPTALLQKIVFLLNFVRESRQFWLRAMRGSTAATLWEWE